MTIVAVICVPGLAGLSVCLEASSTLLACSHLLGVSISRFSLAFGGHSRHTQASLSSSSSACSPSVSRLKKQSFPPHPGTNWRQEESIKSDPMLMLTKLAVNSSSLLVFANTPVSVENHQRIRVC